MQAFIADNPQGQARRARLHARGVRHRSRRRPPRLLAATSSGSTSRPSSRELRRPRRRGRGPRTERCSATMRAWRTHEWGQPLDVLQLDDGAGPGAGTRARCASRAGHPVQPQRPRAHHRRQHDGEPELPYSPGMEVMGVVDACGAGAEAWLGKRVVATTKGADRRLRRVRDLPDAADVRDARRTSRCPDAAALYFPFHLAWLGLFDRAASCRPARAC